MTFLRNAYIVLGAVLGVASVYLAPRFLTSSSDKKSKSNERKSTDIYLIPSPQTESNQKEDHGDQRDNQGNEGKEMEVSSTLARNQINEETIVDKTEGAIRDGMAFLKDQMKELLDHEESDKHTIDPDCAVQCQSNQQPVNGTTAKNLPPNQTPVQDQNNEVLNNEEKEKTIKKTYVKNLGEEALGVVVQYMKTGQAKQPGNNDWILAFQTMEETSSKTDDTNNHFVSIPSEVLPPEKLNSSVYESLEDTTKNIPFKPPRIRKNSSRRESFERSKLVNKNISVISSRKPSAQSTLLEPHNKKIEVKELDEIGILTEESNVHHSTFESDNFRTDGKRSKTLGHRIWRRYVNVFGNLLSLRKRASDKTKLLNAQFSTDNIDLIEDDEANFTRYKQIK